MEKDFYETLPDGYRADKVLDAKDVKTGIVMNFLAAVLMVLVYMATDFITRGVVGIPMIFSFSAEENLLFLFLSFLAFVVSMLVYMVLHELTHGVAYKICTGAKLTFGFTWSAAYCGVPQLYVGRRTALIALLSPFAVFSVVFVAAIALCRDTAFVTTLEMLFALHVGGCVGDLYDILLLLCRYRHGCLLNDTGPRQTFYVQDTVHTDAGEA